MITVYASEQRGGRIKITTDRDCLPPDAIRVSRSRRTPTLRALPRDTKSIR